MPSYQCYIAKIDTPGFYWKDIPDKSFRSGNSPPRLCPKSWADDLPFGYRWIKNKIDSGEAIGKQIDWGGWAIVVTKAQALAWLDEVQQESRFGNYQSLIDEINLTLKDKANYLLVVLENA